MLISISELIKKYGECNDVKIPIGIESISKLEDELKVKKALKEISEDNNPIEITLEELCHKHYNLKVGTRYKSIKELINTLNFIKQSFYRDKKVYNIITKKLDRAYCKLNQEKMIIRKIKNNDLKNIKNWYEMLNFLTKKYNKSIYHYLIEKRLLNIGKGGETLFNDLKELYLNGGE